MCESVNKEINKVNNDDKQVIEVNIQLIVAINMLKILK